MSVQNYPSIVTTHQDEKIHRRILAEASNRHNNGKFNISLEVTLNANAGTTTIQDNRITANSVLVFMPTTANAAGALTSLYVPESTMLPQTAKAPGSAVINHVNDAHTDKSYRVGIFG